MALVYHQHRCVRSGVNLFSHEAECQWNDPRSELLSHVSLFNPLPSTSPPLIDSPSSDPYDLNRFSDPPSCVSFYRVLYLQVPLKDNGINIDVTELNKIEYVRLLVEWHCEKSILNQVHSLQKGFYELMPKDKINIFTVQELKLLIGGVTDVDVNLLRNVCIYKGMLFITTSSSILFLCNHFRTMILTLFILFPLHLSPLHLSPLHLSPLHLFPHLLFPLHFVST